MRNLRILSVGLLDKLLVSMIFGTGPVEAQIAKKVPIGGGNYSMDH